MSISQYPVASAGGASLYSRHTRFTTSGTFTHPDGATPKPIYVVCVSGGAGGSGGTGGTKTVAGSLGIVPGVGGYPGQIADGTLICSTAVTVEVGAGGAGALGGTGTTYAFNGDADVGNKTDRYSYPDWTGGAGGASRVVTSSGMVVEARGQYGPTGGYSRHNSNEQYPEGNLWWPHYTQGTINLNQEVHYPAIRSFANAARVINSLGSTERFVEPYSYATTAPQRGQYLGGGPNGIFMLIPAIGPMGAYGLAGTAGGEGSRTARGDTTIGTAYAFAWNTVTQERYPGVGGTGGATVMTSDADAVAGNGENGGLGCGGGGGGAAGVYSISTTRNITVGGGGDGGPGYVDIFY